MNQFIYKAGIVMLMLILINSVNPAIGLYRLYKNYRLVRPESVNLLKNPSRTDHQVLVIGCSNLQHNIDHKQVQQQLNNVDFLYFSGSQNATFLQYLVDKGVTRGYKNVVLYVPYHILKKTAFLNDEYNVYRSYGSYDYTINLIKHDPSLFFYNWNKLVDSIKAHRPVNLTGSYMTSQDLYMDSLNANNTIYKSCAPFFVHEKQIINIPVYTDEDISFIHDLKLKDQSIYIMYTPIANIIENIHNLAASAANTGKFPDAVNRPLTLDSSYFYDQWYHLNKCGMEIETAKMITILNKISTGADQQH